ncbi:phosphate ABC transporter substrate-binding protein [Dissulfurirhabdus thermomarina]|uniref:Phosphate-binding protein n=1 Tax=Dissulfurirhabdus thermomarina TaxID=1765737 RepID=A0A6N9TV53_DISTH|nr:phosphate ABC transporter substrate-binding protein [Dissulfurirhabdus thermomarina]NDY42386.1 phosphate ABC transporter substrate-binding protein [Dissulfurirhabdus thermomarina]NMX24312.1 phosphate ABC transporter substrate-binding protein [Dissulfurirhabdus thermomarina]
MKRHIPTLFLLAAAAALLAAAAGPARAGQEARYLTVKGSDTMVHLASTWAEAFMKAHPGVEVSVTGGGSGTGIAALLNGTTDICAASRAIRPRELQLAARRGIQPVATVVARDAIAVVVNPANPVSTLTLEQLRKIFTGAVTRWNQVGGPDAPILVLSRDNSSGTFVFFLEHVLQKEDYTPRARFMPATSAIVQAAAADRWAIGYVGLGYAVEAKGRVKTVRIRKDAAAPAVAPSEAAVRDGSYPIARPLRFYTNGAPRGLAKAFVDFCLGPEGQRIVRETGYVPVR